MKIKILHLIFSESPHHSAPAKKSRSLIQTKLIPDAEADKEDA